LGAAPGESGDAIPWPVIALGSVLLIALRLTLWRYRHAGRQVPTPTAAAAISFSCSGCGKNLKANAQLAGKKVKCPRCTKSTMRAAIRAAAPNRLYFGCRFFQGKCRRCDGSRRIL